MQKYIVKFKTFLLTSLGFELWLWVLTSQVYAIRYTPYAKRYLLH